MAGQASQNAEHPPGLISGQGPSLPWYTSQLWSIFFPQKSHHLLFIFLKGTTVTKELTEANKS